MSLDLIKIFDPHPESFIKYLDKQHIEVLEILVESYFMGWDWEYVGIDLQPKALDLALYRGYCVREIGNKTHLDPLRFKITDKGIMFLAENGLVYRISD